MGQYRFPPPSKHQVRIETYDKERRSQRSRPQRPDPRSHRSAGRTGRRPDTSAAHATTPEELLAALHDADVSICYHEPYTREVLANVPRLKAVIRTGVGVDTVDLDAATDYGIMVANFPEFCTREVANHAIVLMMACAKKVGALDRTLRGQGWGAARDLRSPMGAIHDETLGLIAFGNIAHGSSQDRPRARHAGDRLRSIRGRSCL